MPPFIHHRLNALNALLDLCNEALRAHAEGSWRTGELISDLLSSSARTYGDLGMGVAENETLALQAEYAEVRRGGSSREVKKATTLRVLGQCAARLRSEITSHEERLDSARRQLAQIVQYGLDRGVLADAEIDPEEAWRLLTTNPETKPATRQVLLGTSNADALLLVGELLSSVRVPA